MARKLKNFLINYFHDKQFLEYSRQYLSGRLIDVGCGSKPYEAMLAPYVSEHVGLDHEWTKHEINNVDIFGTAYEIPVDDASFDSAICTAVLEHLERPESALRECFRVLKSQGVAIYSAPFIWHLHEAPRDFYRYSKYGLEFLFKEAGFEIISIKPLAGFWVTFGQMLVYKLYLFNRGILKYIPIIPVICMGIQFVAYIFNALDRSEQWTWMYMGAVRKP